VKKKFRLPSPDFCLLTPVSLLLLLACLAVAQAPAAEPDSSPDTIIRAMRDEIARSMKLAVPNLETPYFIQYLMDDSDSFTVSATLGGLTGRRHDLFRNLDVSVRVGDYSFDNTNYIGSDINFGSKYDLERFPLDNSYQVLRRYLWLATDSAYKSAVEAISRKRAALRNLTVSEKIDDFAHAQPVRHLADLRKLSLDENAWTDRVRALSAVFNKYPDVEISSVELNAGDGGYYIVNSEGTEARVPDRTAYLRARGSAQASDGMTVRDAVVYQAFDAAGLPSEAEMRSGIESMAQNIVALAHAPIGEDYNGPVLFESVAGPQVFAEILGGNLGLTRKPVGEGRGRASSVEISELDGRIGARVLPESFDVVDDPTQKEWRGKPLFGSYDIDREGVEPRPVRVIEKGILKDYLLTRQPVRGHNGSNGRARMPGSFGADTPGIGNLFIRSTETMSPAELKAKLLELINARGKPYGIIVRKMDFPSSASVAEVRRLLAADSGGPPVSIPILAYRVYPDGHEELIRGMRFRGFNTRSLKDIIAAGNDLTTFEFMDNPAPFALMGGSGYVSNAAVIAPSILIDDLELHPVEEEQPKLPVVPPPDLTP
jgi:predicted Zn-dependent protease